MIISTRVTSLIHSASRQMCIWQNDAQSHLDDVTMMVFAYLAGDLRATLDDHCLPSWTYANPCALHTHQLLNPPATMSSCCNESSGKLACI